MEYNDYDNPKEYNETFNLLNQQDKLFTINCKHPKKLSLNRNGYFSSIIFAYMFMRAKYKPKTIQKSFQQINEIIDTKNYIKISTKYGNIEFNPIIYNIKEAKKKSGKNKEQYQILKGIYQGEFFENCHYISSCLLSLKDAKMVNAFVSSILQEYRYLHSFIEIDDIVYDGAHNLKISKKDYYNLLDPQITSIITQKQFIEDVEILKNVDISIKDYLVKPEETIQKVKRKLNVKNGK